MASYMLFSFDQFHYTIDFFVPATINSSDIR